MIWDTRKLPKCPRCGKDMYLRTYGAISTEGLTAKEAMEVVKHDALLFKCDGDGRGGCDKHVLICGTGRVYEYRYLWKLIHDETIVKEKVVFT